MEVGIKCGAKLPPLVNSAMFKLQWPEKGGHCVIIGAPSNGEPKGEGDCPWDVGEDVFRVVGCMEEPLLEAGGGGGGFLKGVPWTKVEPMKAAVVSTK